MRKCTDLVDAGHRKRMERVLETLSLDEKESHQRLTDTMQEFNKPINRLDESLQMLQDGLNMNERVNISQWLSPIPIIHHHDQVRRDVLAGTGQWILTNERSSDMPAVKPVINHVASWHGK